MSRGAGRIYSLTPGDEYLYGFGGRLYRKPFTSTVWGGWSYPGDYLADYWSYGGVLWKGGHWGLCGKSAACLSRVRRVFMGDVDWELACMLVYSDVNSDQ